MRMSRQKESCNKRKTSFDVFLFFNMFLLQPGEDHPARGSLKSLLGEYPNLIVLQTLSKAWGMAGLRLGIALADSRVVRLFNRIRYPYNIGTDTLKLALDLIPTAYVQNKSGGSVKERERVRAALSEKACISEVLPSDANFFLIRTDCPRCLYNFLLSRGIIVRDRSNTPACGPALRLTSHPDFIARRGLEQVCRDVLSDERGGDAPAPGEEFRERLLARLACRSAVLFGTDLSEELCLDLLDRLLRDYLPTCPHGRPTTITLTWAELAGKFGR